MAVALDNAHLQLVGIRTAHEHVDVIIGLHNHSVGCGGQFHRLIGHPAEVRHYHEGMSVHLYGISDCLRSVMRNDKIFYGSLVKFIPYALFQHLGAGPE